MEKLWVSFFCYTFAALFNEGTARPYVKTLLRTRRSAGYKDF